jgi:hydroxymethylpyrimidine/phosphomethylpyrimidine kinase
MEIVLSIAGSDPSAGAGIQQDLKTITAHGCYGATVITSITAQNTLGVQSAMPVPPQMVAQQLRAVLSDLEPKAIKIGILPNIEVAQVVVDELRSYLEQHLVPVVYDPVMISTSGYPLMTEDAVAYIVNHLFPLCTLVTPNLPETTCLLRLIDKFVLSSFVQLAGETLAKRYGCAFLLKGGHADKPQMIDLLFEPDGCVSTYVTERIATSNLHGTGCTLSSAIASNLALGRKLPDAVGQAKQFISEAIRRSAGVRIGHGNGPLQMP